jgi:UDP-glucuronate 4-epimerase
MYSQLYPNTKFSGLRLFTVYGDNMRPDLAIYKFMDAMYKHNDIHIYGDGMQMRDFTYIDDVVDGIIHIMKSNKYWQCETFDIGRGEPESINNLL